MPAPEDDEIVEFTTMIAPESKRWSSPAGLALDLKMRTRYDEMS
jgi:hypothetical protein